MSIPPSNKRARTGASPAAEAVPAASIPAPTIPTLDEIKQLTPAALQSLVLALLTLYPQSVPLLAVHSAQHPAPLINFGAYINQLNQKFNVTISRCRRKWDAAADPMYEDTDTITHAMVTACARSPRAENRMACLEALCEISTDMMSYDEVMHVLPVAGVFTIMTERMEDVVRLIKAKGGGVGEAIKTIAEVPDSDDHGMYEFSALVRKLRVEMGISGANME